MYDIFLEKGCSFSPDLTPIIEQYPEMADFVLPPQLTQPKAKSYFLGLDTSVSLASTLLECLITAEASGYRIPAIYRHPNLTIEEAKALAIEKMMTRRLTQNMTTLQKEQSSEMAFSSVRVILDLGVCWKLNVGGSFFFVDKLDGHFWSDENFRLLYYERRLMRRKAKYTKAYISGVPMTRWPEKYTTYDLVFSRMCLTQPDVQKLLQDLPQLADSPMRAHLVPNGSMTEEEVLHFRDFPFLEVALSYEEAKKLALRLQEAGAYVNYIPVAYREISVPLPEAQIRAEQLIREIHEKVVPQDTLGPVQLEKWLWRPYWTFSASSPELIARGNVPGPIFALIDKVDGHIWERDEMFLFNSESMLD